MIYALILSPLVMAAVTYAVPWRGLRPWLLPVGGAAQLVLVFAAILQPAEEGRGELRGEGRGERGGVVSGAEDNSALTPHSSLLTMTGLDGWLRLDALGKLVLGFLAVLFFLCSLYVPGYLALRGDRPNRVFCANL